jgi:hypothetical protein
MLVCDTFEKPLPQKYNALVLLFVFFCIMTAVAIAVWDTSQLQITNQQASSVLGAWLKAGHLASIVHVRVSDADQVLPAIVHHAASMAPGTPVIVVAMATTALLCTDWAVWTSAWMQADKWLWCTGVALGKGKKWQRLVQCEAILQCPCDHMGQAAPVPVWGVLGAVASALHMCLQPYVHSRQTLHQVLGAAWVQGLLFADASPGLAWVWTPRSPLQPLPTSYDFSGPHVRLQQALPGMAVPPASPLLPILDTVRACATSSSTVRRALLAFVIGVVILFLMIILVLRHRLRKPRQHGFG